MCFIMIKLILFAVFFALGAVAFAELSPREKEESEFKERLSNAIAKQDFVTVQSPKVIRNPTNYPTLSLPE